MALMVPAHAGLEHGHALSQPWVSHHEGNETYGVTVGRPITGRTSGRPIRTPPPAAPPLACGITLGRSSCGATLGLHHCMRDGNTTIANCGVRPPIRCASAVDRQ
jgi:hypothetical protein